MNLNESINSLKSKLKESGIDSAALDAKLLLQHALGLEAAQLISQSERVLTPEQQARLEALAARRLAREPMSQILGYRDFWKDRFIVTRDVLTPRPDSETLIEAVLEALPDSDAPLTILDLGTGSGCLLLSLLREYPRALGIGIDISEAAARIARQNATALGLSGRSLFVVSHWMQALQMPFDMIISNPPYIERGQKDALDPEVKDYEPEGALYAGEDGLEAYSHMIAKLPALMKRHGVAVIELGAGQAGAVGALAQQHGLNVCECHADLGGIDRAMVLSKPTKD